MTKKTQQLRLSADIGGTFTDLVMQDASTGETTTAKILSTKEDPGRAVLEGIEHFVSDEAVIDFLIHGTTVGLNAVLERKGAELAILTTENYRDIYTIAGNDRKEIFATQYRKPQPLVRPRDIYTVSERIAADGSVLKPIDTSDLETLVAKLRERGTESLAVCLLFSYLNPAHELVVRDFLAQAMPELSVTLSHQVSPEWREYARTSTAAMNAYVAPVVTRYLQTLISAIEPKLGSVVLHVMESNGGAMTASAAQELPIQTLLSGPVGGTIGAQSLSEVLRLPNLICIDMGGTSFDASLVVEGRATVSPEAEIEHLPLQMSAVDIHVIGAGGGSIAWLEGGHIRVGPQSAGADPGPACYSRGGTQPTVTDANLVLGRIHEARFAGGGMRLDLEAARAAVDSVAAAIGLDTSATAEGIVEIVNAKMADAIRTITVERGIDPREFALVAYGGAGPMHAVELAGQLEIATVIVPQHPGAFSAWGMLNTDVRHDLRATHFTLWESADVVDLNNRFGELEAAGARVLAAEGITDASRSFERSVDLRYVGQEYSLTVPLERGELDTAEIRQKFDRAYLKQFGHSQPAAKVEVVNLRVAAVGHLERLSSRGAAPRSVLAAASRKVVFSGALMPTAIVDRESIGDDVVSGPAIIEEDTATSVVPPGWDIHQSHGHLVIERIPA